MIYQAMKTAGPVICILLALFAVAYSRTIESKKEKNERLLNEAVEVAKKASNFSTFPDKNNEAVVNFFGDKIKAFVDEEQHGSARFPYANSRIIWVANWQDRERNTFIVVVNLHNLSNGVILRRRGPPLIKGSVLAVFDVNLKDNTATTINASQLLNQKKL